MTSKTSATPALSLIIPTRERAAYLGYAIQTCMLNPNLDLEILVLDNASTDNTRDVVARVADPRVRYIRNEERLSMRDNFEKGIAESRGEIIGFIGDDDGVLPDAVDRALSLFRSHDVDAVSAARAHYFWPDLVSARRDTALLPRGRGVRVLDSKSELRHVLTDCNYYRLPCLYHGFVKRALVDRISKRQGRFFLSSQVDMFSSIALSMEGIRYAFSEYPLVINGASSRSNGASHFGGGIDKEKSLWKKEDDLGFLPGFETCLTVGALIVESALRYGQANQLPDVAQVLDLAEVERALIDEGSARIAAGQTLEQAQVVFATTKIPAPLPERINGRRSQSVQRVSRLVRSFLRTMPLNMRARGIADVYAAAQCMRHMLEARATGLVLGLPEQISVALKISRKNDHV